jgi:hypothetical protein
MGVHGILFPCAWLLVMCELPSPACQQDQSALSGHRLPHVSVAESGLPHPACPVAPLSPDRGVPGPGRVQLPPQQRPALRAPHHPPRPRLEYRRKPGARVVWRQAGVQHAARGGRGPHAAVVDRHAGGLGAEGCGSKQRRRWRCAPRGLLGPTIRPDTRRGSARKHAAQSRRQRGEHCGKQRSSTCSHVARESGECRLLLPSRKSRNKPMLLC